MTIMTKRIAYSIFALTLCITSISQAMEDSKRKDSSSSSESSDENTWMQWPTSGMLLKQDAKTKQDLMEELCKTKKELAWTKLTLMGAEHLHSQFFGAAKADYESACRTMASLQERNASLQSRNNALESSAIHHAQHNADQQDTEEAMQVMAVMATIQHQRDAQRIVELEQEKASLLNLLLAATENAESSQKIAELEQENAELMNLVLTNATDAGAINNTMHALELENKQLRQKNTKIINAYNTVVNINDMQRNLLTQFENEKQQYRTLPAQSMTTFRDQRTKE